MALVVGGEIITEGTRMGAATYIGRVGGLAVALGVGTAIATGHGIAAADDTDSAAANTQIHRHVLGHVVGNRINRHQYDDEIDNRYRAHGRQQDVIDDIDDGGVDRLDNHHRHWHRRCDGGRRNPHRTQHRPAPAPITPDESDTPTKTPDADPPPKTDDTKETTDTTPADKGSSGGALTTPSTAKSGTPTPSAGTGTTDPGDPADTIQKTDKVAVFATARTLAAATAPRTLSAMTAAQVAQPSATALTAPVATAPPHPLTSVVKVVSSVLNWAMNFAPTAPAQPTLAWTLLAFARREIDNLLAAMDPTSAPSTAGVALETTSLALSAAAVNPRPGFPYPGQQLSPSTSFVDWVTGNYLPNDTFDRFGIWGTDVGTMWDNGIPDDPSTPINEHQVLVAFGDTFGGPNMTGTWRLNTLFRSSDLTLADGMAVPPGQWLNGNMFGGSPLWE